jgi:hypothetical protein
MFSRKLVKTAVPEVYYMRIINVYFFVFLLISTAGYSQDKKNSPVNTAGAVSQTQQDKNSAQKQSTGTKTDSQKQKVFSGKENPQTNNQENDKKVIQAQDVNKKTTAQADSLNKAEQDSIYSFSMPVLKYNSLGKRDPFESLAPAPSLGQAKIKDLFNYDGSKILGIASTEKGPYALVTDTVGAGYVLKENDNVLGGIVSKITDDAVFLHIVKYGRAMTIIMRIESSKVTVIEESGSESTVKKPGIDISYNKEPINSKEISIQEVSIPSLDTKTIEEQWFGAPKKLTDIIDENSADSKAVQGSFYLISPADKTWIKLPYLFKWTEPKETKITYKFIVDDDPDFSSPLFETDGISSKSYLLIAEDAKLPVNRELYWTVLAVQESGNILYPKQSGVSFRVVGESDRGEKNEKK